MIRVRKESDTMSKVESTGDSASREFKRFITSGRRRMLSKIYHPFGASFIVNAEEALYGHGNLVTTPNSRALLITPTNMIACSVLSHPFTQNRFCSLEYQLFSS